VSGAALSISPVPEISLGSVVAERIVTDHGGTVERGDASLTLRWSG